MRCARGWSFIPSLMLIGLSGCGMIGWHVPDAKERVEIDPTTGKIVYESALDSKTVMDGFEAIKSPDGSLTVKFKKFGRDSEPSTTYRGFAEYTDVYGRRILGPGGVQGVIRASGQAGKDLLPWAPFIARGPDGQQQGVYVPDGVKWIPLAPEGTAGAGTSLGMNFADYESKIVPLLELLAQAPGMNQDERIAQMLRIMSQTGWAEPERYLRVMFPNLFLKVDVDTPETRPAE